MALNFPSSPTNGDLHTDPTTGLIWEWVASPGYWKSYGTGTFQDNAFKIADNLDNSKNVVFQIAGLTSGNQRIISAADVDINLTPDITYSSYGLAVAAFNAANNASDTWVRVHANAAFSQANAAQTVAILAFGQANAAQTVAILAYGTANQASLTAIGAFGNSNTQTIRVTSAWSQANAAQTVAILAYGQANQALLVAQGAFGNANAQTIRVTSAWAQANAAQTVAILAYGTANQAQLTAVGAFEMANTPSGGSYFKGNNGDVGGATGLGDVFRIMSNTITSNIQVGTGTNALAAGPIIIAEGQTLTAQSGARIVIV